MKLVLNLTLLCQVLSTLSASFLELNSELQHRSGPFQKLFPTLEEVYIKLFTLASISMSKRRSNIYIYTFIRQILTNANHLNHFFSSK